jgi:hypothetical protein
MSGLIHFVSGKTLEITEKEMRDMPISLTGKGVKVKKMKSGALVPMNSTTIEFVEPIKESEEEVAESTLPMEHGETAILKPMDKQEAPETPKTPDEILADMTAKSNCKHEPEKLVLYRQHTAKGIRYFPRCSFCGKRERYVSESKIVKGEYKGTPNEKWTERDITDAIDWIED